MVSTLEAYLEANMATGKGNKIRRRSFTIVEIVTPGRVRVGCPRCIDHVLRILLESIQNGSDVSG